MKKVVSGIVVLLLLFCLVETPIAFAAQSEVVRVGYYPLSGYQQMDESGVRTGVGYEYYQELAQYTDWKYVFEDASYEKCAEKLTSGEIDLMWGMPKSVDAESLLLFSDFSVGSATPVLYTTKYNAALLYEDYPNFNGIRVGLVDKNLQSSQLDALCSQKELTLTRVLYATQEEMNAALQKGEIDAAFAINLNNTDETKIIASLEEIPLYFATAKSNSDLMDELNQAILKVKTLNPFFEAELSAKYITTANGYYTAFTQQEQEYIDNTAVVRVIYDPNWRPIEYRDEKTGEYKGITADVFKIIQAYTGLNFVYVAPSNFTQALEMIENGDGDVLASLTREYDWAEAHNMYFSTAILKANVVMVTRTATNANVNVLALPKSYCTTKRIEQSQPDKIIVEYDSVEDCLHAVRQGRADATYLNANVANYFLGTGSFSSLRIAGLTDYNENLAIAVSKRADPVLLSIINKALLQISAEEMNSIILEHNVPAEKTSMKNIFYAYPVECAIIISLAAGVAIILMAILLKTNSSKNKKIQQMLGETHLNSERFRIALQQVSCDVFEYDIGTQTLFKTNKTNGQVEMRQQEEQSPLLLDYAYGQLDEKNRETFKRMFLRVARGDQKVSDVIKSTLEDGTLCWKKITLIPLKQGYVLSRVIGTVEDVTSEYMAKMRYETEQKYRNAMLSNAIAALTVNLTTEKIINCYKGEHSVIKEAENINYDLELLSHSYFKVYPQDKEAMQEVFATENLLNAYHFGYQQLDHTFRVWHEESALWIKVTVNLVKAPDTGDIMGFMYAQDVHEEEQQKRKLQSAARQDALTGLYNRTAIEQAVTQVMQNKKKNVSCAFFMFDVDNFKQVNDQYGHINGDAALVIVAETLKRHFRAEDIIARMGGDEFAVFMPHVPCYSFLQQRAEELLEDLRNHPLQQLQHTPISISIGIAVAQKNISFETLYSRADTALYTTKQGGKNNFHIYA